MGELIEQYERKLKAIKPMIESAKFDEDAERELRLRVKMGCYRAFLSDLKRAEADSLGLSSDVVKSLPNDEEVKAHIDTLPYYGTCTTEYNEGFEDGVKWLKEQLAK